MKATWYRPWLTAVLGIAAAAVWSIVIFTALHVSTVVLNTLDMIVELAGMNPPA